MSAQWKAWLIGLANAAVSGAAGAVGGGIAGANGKQIAIIAGTSAAVSLAKWILQHPLPGAQQ